MTFGYKEADFAAPVDVADVATARRSSETRSLCLPPLAPLASGFPFGGRA
ncbi:hypothetical protein AKJ09_01408 [Labilithrix luteola]|uniref:Uncharacterized protein n=1 Tax=Labilithrix luteola TaxID=1391654 RepID=A0A0K1PNS1_9BACT|nr:hypothetical protein AKJ09_01408 [Labilithrix luteola]